MKRTLILAAALAVLFLGAAVPGRSQDEMRQLADPAFAPAKRAAVPFDHDAHNAAAGIENCAACHHAYENGVLQKDQDSVGVPCSDCHPLKAGMAAAGGQDVTAETTLMNAYHRQCQTCHEQRGKGPVMCGECHPKG